MAKPLLYVCNHFKLPYGKWKTSACLFQFCEHLLPMPVFPDLSTSASKSSRAKCSNTLLWWFPFSAERGPVLLWWLRIVMFSNITNSFDQKASMKMRWRNNWKTPILSLYQQLFNLLFCFLQLLPNWSYLRVICDLKEGFPKTANRSGIAEVGGWFCASTRTTSCDTAGQGGLGWCSIPG